MPIGRIGTDVIVNSTFTGDQTVPNIAALAGGKFVITWQSTDTSDGSLGCVRARVFNSDGSAFAADFIVDSTASLAQRRPSVSAFADSRFIVTWESDDTGDGSGGCVRARIFNSDGSPVANDFFVDTSTSGSQTSPTVAVLSDGRFIETWQSNDGGDGSGYCLRARIYSASGTAAGNDFLLNTTFADFQFSPVVKALSNGRFVAIWSSGDTGDGSGSCERARFFNANGTPAGNDFLIDSTGFASQYGGDVTELSDGTVAFTWTSQDNGDGDQGCVRARVTSASGVPIVDDFIVNTTVAGSQSAPRLALLADGRYAFTWWSSDSGDGSGVCIRAKMYNADGTASGSDFLVNTVGTGNQFDPSIVALADDRFVIAWDSFEAGDGSGSCIRSQIFDAKVYNGSVADENYIGGSFGNNISGGGGNDTLTGLGGNDTINGDAGNDKLFGGDGNDKLFGGIGTDALFGGNGDDALIGGAGDDAMDGGTGTDTAHYSATLAISQITYHADHSVTITTAADGTDTLFNVEFANFADGTVSLVPIPVAVNDGYSTAFNTALTIAGKGVLANDADPAGLALTAAVAAGPAHGTVALGAAGNFVYTPAATFSGTDTFTYTATNTASNIATGTVSINVGAPPPPPPVSPPPPPVSPPPPPVSPPPPPPPPPVAANFSVTDTTTGVTSTAPGDVYTGPVPGLAFQYIYTGADSLNVTGQVPNGFIHTGSGFDAIDVSVAGGTNVLDGGTNSNFLVGGKAGSGSDTFFVDDRSPPADIWSTVVNFHAGDAATIFGITQTGFATTWVDGEGAAGFTGLTLHVTAPGVPIASITLAGYTTADLGNGRLTQIFGNEADGTPYLYIHGDG